MVAATIKPPLRVIEIARRYGVHRDTVYGWIKAGVEGKRGGTVRLEAMKVGGVIRIRRADLRAFLDACGGRRPDRLVRSRRKAGRSQEREAAAAADRMRARVGGKVKA